MPKAAPIILYLEKWEKQTFGQYIYIYIYILDKRHIFSFVYVCIYIFLNFPEGEVMGCITHQEQSTLKQYQTLILKIQFCLVILGY